MLLTQCDINEHVGGDGQWHTPGIYINSTGIRRWNSIQGHQKFTQCPKRRR